MAYSAPQYRHKALDLPRPLRQERPVLDQHLPDLLEASDRIEVVAHLSPHALPNIPYPVPQTLDRHVPNSNIIRMPLRKHHRQPKSPILDCHAAHLVPVPEMQIPLRIVFATLFQKFLPES